MKNTCQPHGGHMDDGWQTDSKHMSGRTTGTARTLQTHGRELAVCVGADDRHMKSHEKHDGTDKTSGGDEMKAKDRMHQADRRSERRTEEAGQTAQKGRIRRDGAGRGRWDVYF